MFTIKKLEETILTNRNEEQVRSFAGDLNEQINWKRQCKSAPFATVLDAITANGYTVIEE